jgi:hypothetical protein
MIEHKTGGRLLQPFLTGISLLELGPVQDKQELQGWFRWLRPTSRSGPKDIQNTRRIRPSVIRVCPACQVSGSL